MLLSMVGLVWRLNHPDLVVVSGEGSDRLVVRVLGPLYFANIGVARDRLLELAGSDTDRPKTLVLDLVGVPDADVTMLLRLPEVERDLRERGVELEYENVTPRVRELHGARRGWRAVSRRVWWKGLRGQVVLLVSRQGRRERSYLRYGRD